MAEVGRRRTEVGEAGWMDIHLQTPLSDIFRLRDWYTQI